MRETAFYLPRRPGFWLAIIVGLGGASCGEQTKEASTAPPGQATAKPFPQGEKAKPVAPVARTKVEPAYYLPLSLRGDGEYRWTLGGGGAAPIPSQKGADRKIDIPIPKTALHREVHSLRLSRSYAYGGEQLKARATFQVPVFGFERASPRRTLRLAALTPADCSANDKPPRPRSEFEAVQSVITWENVVAACENVPDSENMQIHALSRALYAQKWLVQNFPEDYVISGELRKMAEDMLRTNRRCTAGNCRPLQTEVDDTRFLDYKIYTPLTQLSGRHFEGLSDAGLKAAASALVISEKAYAECIKDSQKYTCNPADFPQLRLDICREVERRQRTDIHTCPPRSRPPSPAPGTE